MSEHKITDLCLYDVVWFKGNQMLRTNSRFHETFYELPEAIERAKEISSKLITHAHVIKRAESKKGLTICRQYECLETFYRGMTHDEIIKYNTAKERKKRCTKTIRHRTRTTMG